MKTCEKCGFESTTQTIWCDSCGHHLTVSAMGRIASPARRLAAHIMDFTIVIFLFFGLAGVGISGEVGIIFSIIGLLLFIVWSFILFAKGQTPGKKTMGIRVARKNGINAGFGVMLIREWIGKWISALFFGIGFLWLLWDQDNQCLHDKLMNTYVVKTRGKDPS